MCLVLNIFINTKTSKPVCLCLSALFSTVDSKTDDFLSELSRTQDSAIKREGQIWLSGYPSIKVKANTQQPLHCIYPIFFALFKWTFLSSLYKEWLNILVFNTQSDKEKSIGYIPPLYTLWRGGELFAACSQGRGQPCEAASWDQTASSFSPLIFPINPWKPLSTVCLFSTFIASVFTSLLFIFLPLELTLSPRSYSQSAVPALLLLLQGWSAAVQWCSASCWRRPSAECWGDLPLSLLHPCHGGPSHLACPSLARQLSCGHGHGLMLGGSSSWSCGAGPWTVWHRCSAGTGPSGGGWAGPWWAPSRFLVLCRLLQ